MPLGTDTVLICHSSHHFLTSRALGGRSDQLDLVDRNSLSPARYRLGPFTRHSLGSSQRPARVTPAYPATVLRSSRCPASGQLEEVMWGCRRRVCDNHCSRCSRTNGCQRRAAARLVLPARCLLRVILGFVKIAQRGSISVCSLAPSAEGGVQPKM